MILSNRILFLLILELVRGDNNNGQSNSKKSVTFKEDLEDVQENASSEYFNFGDKSSKKLKKSSASMSQSKSYTKSQQSHSQSQQRRNHRPSFEMKLKSALKRKEPQLIYQSNSQKSNGAFDMSKSIENSSVNKRALYGDVSSFGGQLENANAYIESNNGAYVPPNPYRNVGPTPQILSDLSPERFWLPPNAPITQEIPGPFLPISYGVPGQVPVTNGLPIVDFYSPGVPDYTGPRDIDNVQVDPLTPADIARQSGVGTIGTYRPPYEVPRILQPLNPVTPIPGGNIIDPLSPQVNNLRGPFFPNRPLNDGAFLMEAEQPQIIARDLEDGPYIVERVTDPIVFFDPIRGQTVIYDPVRDFTRLYNPETDPQLPIEEEDAVSSSETGTETTNMAATGASNGAQQAQTQLRQNRMNGGAFLKSMLDTKNGGEPPKNPAFWILKHITNSELEKSNGSNGNSNGRIIFQGANVKSPDASQSPKKASKKQIISHYKAPNQVQNPQIPQAVQPASPVENFRIQLASTNDEKEEKNVSKTEKTGNDSKDISYKVTLVYSPIVDIDLKKRYGGFKAQGNDATYSSKPSIITTLSIALIFLIIVL